MSNVYTRNRKKTPSDVLANAEKLQDLVTLYVMNERYVPKKWRFMIGQDLIKKIDELNDNIIAANSIYAMNEQMSRADKAYAQKAIATLPITKENSPALSGACLRPRPQASKKSRAY